MTLSEQIFGKELFDLSFNDLENFFKVARKENQILEFKSGEVSVENVCKEICAFLNTSGGILIIGAPKEIADSNDNEENKICKGSLTPTSFKGKDWLISKITSNIVPFPRDIAIKEFSTKEGNYFVIHVPSSSCPPHQSFNDGRYYIRKNESSIPATHETVENLFYKRTRPLIRTDVHFKNVEEYITRFDVHIQNESEHPVKKINYSLEIYNVRYAEQTNTNLSFEEDKTLNCLKTRELLKTNLIKDQTEKIHFTITHKGQPFYILIKAWSQKAFTYSTYLLYDPANEIILRNNSGNNLEPGLIFKYKNSLDELLGKL